MPDATTPPVSPQPSRTDEAPTDSTSRHRGERLASPSSSQIAMSSTEPLVDIRRDEAMSSQFARRSSRRRGATYRPWAFTEHGALMAANILRLGRAQIN